MKKQIFAAVSALLLSFCLAVGLMGAVPAKALTRGGGSEETEDTGYYILTYIAYGEESLDEEYLSMFGMAGGIVLEEDGTGYIYLFDEITDLTWKDGTMAIEGEEVVYAVTDGVLEFTIEDAGESMVLQFTRSEEPAPTREEIAAMFAENYGGEDPEPGFSLEEEPETVIVATTEELMENLAQNATLILLPGEYNVSEWLANNAAETWDQATYDSDGYLPAGIYTEEVFDGSQLILNDFDYVTIMSADKNDPAKIVCDPRYANVLTFVDCDDLTLDHIVMGHSDSDGSCTGNVLSLIYSWNVNVIDCDLYGCGTYGLNIDDSYNVNVIDSLIHDCTYGCAVINASTVTMKYTEFYECREFTMFEITESDVDFIGCVFEDLDGEFMNELDDYSEVNLVCCKCDDAVTADIEIHPSYDAGLYVY